MDRNKIYMILRFLFIVTAVIVTLTLVLFIAKYTYPFLIGLAIAYMINPLVNFIESKTKLPRGFSVLFSLVGIFALFAGLITWLIVELVSGAEYLARVVPNHFNTVIIYIENFITTQVVPLYNQMSNLLSSLDEAQQQTIITNIENYGKNLAGSVGHFVQALLGKIPLLISWLPNTATLLVFSLLGTFFISKDWNHLANISNKIIPHKAKTSSQTVFIDLKKALVGFIKAQATLISISTVITLIGLIILRIDHAVTIALLIGVLDILPYLGTGLVFVPWVVYEALAGDMSLAIGIGVIYTVVIVQRQIMEPKILSANIGVDPLSTLIALFAGFKLFGFLGLIIGPVSLVLITTLYRANVFHEAWGYIKGDNK